MNYISIKEAQQKIRNKGHAFDALEPTLGAAHAAGDGDTFLQLCAYTIERAWPSGQHVDARWS